MNEMLGAKRLISAPRGAAKLGQAGEAVREEGGGDDEEEDEAASAPHPGKMVFRRQQGGIAAGVRMPGDAVKQGERSEEAASGQGSQREGGRDFRPDP